MSKSYKKTPIFGNTTAHSEKEDKQNFNRSMRSNNKILLQKLMKEEIDFDEAVFYTEDEIEDVWGFNKDGKHYYRPFQSEHLEKMMRK